MPRPRHPRKELEQLLRDAELQGWQVTKGRYFKLACPCPQRHLKWVHLTPSGANYERNLRAELARSTCWRVER